eukprot:CAMPEP_0167802896 /NCGR_PEP_ID=MMETSP0111_2-20121227/19425_1 /TAXON_ID=91324 /ORGANISM="Lotharella globosa, Strain CCCM811" /LENGTH=180 /DNA_ID=CAMNT_0007699085 /DNA_START=30 /DNA_END=572 /DNA_ORIENTATION=+
MTPLSALLVMPLFALANTAVPLVAGGAAAAKLSMVGLGVLAGLVIGKPIGIFGLTMMAVRSGLGTLPPGMQKKHLGAVGTLGAIGFTMSIFLADVALKGFAVQDAKIGIFLASLLATGIGSAYMATFPKWNADNLLKSASPPPASPASPPVESPSAPSSSSEPRSPPTGATPSLAGASGG